MAVSTDEIATCSLDASCWGFALDAASSVYFCAVATAASCMFLSRVVVTFRPPPCTSASLKPRLDSSCSTWDTRNPFGPP